MYTANRIYELVADNAAEMHMWIGVLSPKKFSQRDDFTCLHRGTVDIVHVCLSDA